MDDQSTDYAQLPGDLLYQILKDTDDIAERASSLINIDEKQVETIKSDLAQRGLIQNLEHQYAPDLSIMAVDGGQAMDRLTGGDLLIAVAVGVEGIAHNDNSVWSGKNEYLAWNQIVAHHEDNARLMSGLMHLMELILLHKTKGRDVMIMDGSHLTPVLKLNSMMSIDSELAKQEFDRSLGGLLNKSFGWGLIDIPDVLSEVLSDTRVISLNKYNSSRDFIEGVTEFHKQIRYDDKTFFSIALNEDEYTTPLPVGQSKREKERWQKLHINCNLGDDKTSKAEIDERFRGALSQVKMGAGKESSLYYTYFKPSPRLAYRIELKEGLARDHGRLQRTLASLKHQVVDPFLTEPLPQFIADGMAKQVSASVRSIKESILHSSANKIKPEHIHLLMPYRG